MNLSQSVHLHDDTQAEAEVFTGGLSGPFAVVKLHPAGRTYPEIALIVHTIPQIVEVVAALEKAGSMLAAAMTPDQAEEEAEEVVMRPLCASKDCTNPVYRDHWCKECLEKLASGEAVLTQEQAEALWPEGAVLATKCVSEGCDEPQHKGSLFCAACLQKLYSEIPF